MLNHLFIYFSAGGLNDFSIYFGRKVEPVVNQSLVYFHNSCTSIDRLNSQIKMEMCLETWRFAEFEVFVEGPAAVVWHSLTLIKICTYPCLCHQGALDKSNQRVSVPWLILTKVMKINLVFLGLLFIYLFICGFLTVKKTQPTCNFLFFLLAFKILNFSMFEMC